MAPTAISNEVPAYPTNAAPASGSTQGDEFSNSLTPLLSPPVPQSTSEPDPPPATQTENSEAEGAAKTPNVNSQKLDSPQNSRKVSNPSKDSLDDLTMASGVMPSLVLQVPQNSLVKSVSADGTASVASIGKSVSKNVLANSDEANEAKAESAFKNSNVTQQPKMQALPEDHIAPITSVTSTSSAPKPTVPQISLSDVKTAFAKPGPAAVDAKAAVASPGVGKNSEVQLVAPGVVPATSPAKPAGAVARTGASGNPIGATAAIGTVDKGSGGNASSFGQQSDFGQSSNSSTSGPSAVSKPTASSDSDSIDRKSLITQVANHFDNVAAANPKGGIVVQLSPPSMGNITVTIKTVGKQIDAQVAATNLDVKTALEQSRPELTQAMESRGYSVSSMNFTTEPGSSASQFSDQGKQQSSNTAQPQVRTAAVNSASQPISVSPSLNRAKAPAGVDLWI